MPSLLQMKTLIIKTMQKAFLKHPPCVKVLKFQILKQRKKTVKPAILKQRKKTVKPAKEFRSTPTYEHANT